MQRMSLLLPNHGDNDRMIVTHNLHWRRCQVADFRNNGIGVMGVTALCAALKSNDTLSSLLLGTNSIGDEGAELLARYLAGVRFSALSSSRHDRCHCADARSSDGRHFVLKQGTLSVLQPSQPLSDPGLST